MKFLKVYKIDVYNKKVYTPTELINVDKIELISVAADVYKDKKYRWISSSALKSEDENIFQFFITESDAEKLF